MGDVDTPLLVRARGDLTDAQLVRIVGGKALNLLRLSEMLAKEAAAGPTAGPRDRGGAEEPRPAVIVPAFFAVTTHAFALFMRENDLAPRIRVPAGCADLGAHAASVRAAVLEAAIPESIRAAVATAHAEIFGSDDAESDNAAVRSSGTDEDSGDYSFAGQYESYLFQRGLDAVLRSLKECWASAFSERVLAYRMRAGLVPEDSLMGVVVQRMVTSSKSGVAFSRHPLRPVSTGAALVSAVWGVGEGLVSGELDSDEYVVSRASSADGGPDATDISADANDMSVIDTAIADKEEEFVRDAATGDLTKIAVAPPARRTQRCLVDAEAVAVARMAVAVEEYMNKPQDTEWAFEDGQLYLLQARPIPTLPNSYIFSRHLDAKRDATLWDNSNVVESYPGVTTPLTFSWAVIAYWKAYRCTFRNNGVPDAIVESHDPYLRNMLGLQRGHIYYNLMNWYRALGAVPLPESMRDKMMDDMMGVKQGMGDELTALVGTARETVPDYGTGDRVGLLGRLFSSWLHMDEMVVEFLDYFETWYEHWRRRNFRDMTMHELVTFYHGVVRDIIEEWDVPPANDTLVMAFFGSLKKATMALPGMDGDEDKATELINQLLQGQDVKSFKPTEHLMSLATQIDASDAKEWFVQTDSKDIAARIMEVPTNVAGASAATTTAQESILQGVRNWVDEWGFRCACELKLEENDYFDDPTFLVDQLQGYLRSGKFDISVIKERERTTKAAAESRLAALLSGVGCVGRAKYYWILRNARRHVTHRENLRFARTQLWGILRKLFRGFGAQMFRIEALASPNDIFYLTCDEIVAFVEGRGVTRDLQAIVDTRKSEFEGYRAAPEPPERFLTFGPQGAMMKFPLVLTDLDLLKDLNASASSDPNVLMGKPCCPGVVEKVVRVVKDVRECAGMNGEILVTARTDPGWVTVYPMLGGILIERGSLLSHSAVVAREVGLPAIVSITGGLTSRLKTGMLVRMDGAAGTVTILKDENGVPVESPEDEEGREGREEKSAVAEASVNVAGLDEDEPETRASFMSLVCSLICGSVLLPFAMIGCLYTCACGACIFTRTSPKRWEAMEPGGATEGSANNKAAVATMTSSTGESKENLRVGGGDGEAKETEMVKIRINASSSSAPSASFKPLVRATYDDPAPNSFGAWYKFFMERIPVVVYGLLTGGMVLSGSYASAEKYDAFGFWVGFAIGMLFLVLLRFMDEAKDIEKDKVGHPERPLPRGLVSLSAVTRAIYFMSLLLLGASIACFWINTASGVSALIVTFVLGLMYAEFFCEETLDNSPLLVAITHQSIIFPLSVFVCCVNNENAWNEPRTYFFACVMLGSMLTYEICRKLDPKAHKILGTYLIAYGPWGVFAMVFASTVINVGGAVGLAFSLDGQVMSLSFQEAALQVWPVSFLVTPALVVLVSLFALNITGSPGKSHKWVELFSILSLLFQWFAIPIAVRAGLFIQINQWTMMWTRVAV